jgi:hypothetical protein
MSISVGILWVPVPRGIENGKFPRITLLAIPQIASTTGPTTIASVPLFSGGTWVDLINGVGGAPGMSFNVTFDDPGSGQRMSGPAKRVSINPATSVFRTMFPDSTTVTTYSADDYSQSKIRSANLGGLNDALNTAQEQVFRGSAAVRPEVSALVSASGGLIGGYAIDESTMQQISELINGQLNTQGYTDSPNTSTEPGLQTAIVQLKEFAAPVETDPAVLAAPAVWPQWEFHEKFSVLDSHPNLLRQIGFIIDLEVDPAEMQSSGTTPTTSIPTNGELRINALYTAPGTVKDLPVGVRYTLTATDFNARYRTPPTSPGFVDIRGDGRDWPIVTSEVGAEVLATTALATGLARAESESLRTDFSRAREGLPARTSSGVILLRPKMAERQHDEFIRQWKIAQSISFGSSTAQVFDAEEMVIGYRMDVRVAGLGPWLSLNLRNGFWRPDPDTYGAGLVDLSVDEGWTEPAGIGPESNTTNEYRYSGVVSAWLGWSQAIERPGGAVDEASEANFINPLSPPPPQFGATIDYKAPPGGAQLPTLRFGTLYEVRLREVFMGGVARELSATAPTSAIRSVTYRRHEPVVSPVVYIGDIKGEGPYSWAQTSQTSVIRSMGNGATVDPSETSTRWLTPPRVAPWLVEQHGLLDSGGRPDPAKYSQIATRDAANYGPTTPGYAADGDVITFNWSTPSQGVTPFYPDPLGSGVLIRGVPVPSGTVFAEASANFGGSWPDVVPVQLNVGGSGTPGATVSGQVVDLQVAPGRTEYLRISCSIPSGDLNLLDLWSRVSSSASATDAAKGAYWQLSPDRRLTVVHAVKQPVSAPYFDATDTWTAARARGETPVDLDGTLHLDQPSVESVTLTGEITSGIDGGPGTPEPRIETNDAGQIGTVNVDNPAPGGPATAYPLQAVVQLPDTKRRDLELTATAFSRYAEYFRQATDVSTGGSSAEDTITVVPDSSGAAQPIVPGSARLTWTSGDTTVTGTLDVDYSEDAAAGTITLLPGGSVPAGAAVISGITTPITLATSDAPSTQQARDIVLPASSRPLQPEVASVVPAWSWSTPSAPSVGGSAVTSTRSSSSLRLYLDRPWWSSGLEEDLAVLLRSSRRGAAVSDYVTRWGGDPAVTGGGSLPANWPAARHFTNAAGSVSGVSMAEDSSLSVDLVRYTVGREAADGSLIGWDAERDQWYVDLDIDIDDAYRPFVRLALARYQAGAPAQLRLSPVTLLDVVQIDPTRTATVQLTRVPRVGVQARVTLTGPAFKKSKDGSGPGRAFAIHERLNADVALSSDATYWQEVKRTELTASYDNASGEGSWTGRLNLGSGVTGGRDRLVIEQYEEWRTDGRPNSAAAGTETGLRLVHQDVIPLG